MKKTIALLFIVLTAVLAACAIDPAVPPTETPGVGLANPASVYCGEQGGQVVIKTDGTGGQYGVCLFDDNRQCEEWAMMRGDCPIGGLKITGYLTEPARFCAISGGTYDITANSGESNETGTCTFANGVVCPADAYYDHTCSGLPE